MVALEWRGHIAQLRIWNPVTADRLEIVDPKFNRSDWPPIGVYVRVSDQTGAIVRHRHLSDDLQGEGWWTELFMSSDWRDAVVAVGFSMPPIEPPAMLTLDPGDAIEIELDPRLLVHGMRPEHPPETEICRVQVRATIYDSRQEAVAIRTTEWLDVRCRELQFSLADWSDG